jgi:hypothetical protein
VKLIKQYWDLLQRKLAVSQQRKPALPDGGG